MPYRYLEDIAIADVAFEAWAETEEGLFGQAGEALMHVMVENIDEIRGIERKLIRCRAGDLERLLFEFLQEMIFFKDAEQLLVRTRKVKITREGGSYLLVAEAVGEKIDRSRHALNADVKAVTLHRFEVREDPEGWHATVVLDI